MAWFKRMVFILLFNIGWYTVSSVEIIKSVSPSPPYRIEKPPTITWSIKYKEDEQGIQGSLLYLNGLEMAIASSANGLTKEGRADLNGKANVTITATEVCVKFFRLEYVDEFNFTCLAFGGKDLRSIVKEKSELYISNIKGGPAFCGDSGLKDVYVFSPGTSTFDVTICGHDRPKLWYTFDGETKEAESTIVDVKARKYKYKIMIEDLKVKHCGQELIFKSEGSGTIERMSKVFVKYQPLTIKDFEFLHDIHRNCSIINIKNPRNTACPLKYILTIYDAQKNILKVIKIRNPVTTNTTNSIKTCSLEWYTNGAYATVQAVWEHQSSQNSIKGNVSNFVKVQKGFNKMVKPNNNGTEYVIFLVLIVSGLLLILVIILSILYKYKYLPSPNSTNTNQNTSNQILKEIPEYEEIKTELMNRQTYEQLDLNSVRYDNYEQLIKEPNKCIYSELGKEGGRKGAKPKKQRPSNYADAKDVDYSIPHMRRL